MGILKARSRKIRNWDQLRPEELPPYLRPPVVGEVVFDPSLKRASELANQD
jgi:hypothetical protein